MDKAQNESKLNILLSVIGCVFVLDEVLLPVFRFSGIPMKISYIIELIWLILYLMNFRMRIFGETLKLTFEKGSYGKKVFLRFMGLILLTCAGQFTMHAFSNILETQSFTDAIKYYLFMVTAFGVGYICYKFNKKVLLYALYIYCALNFALLMFFNQLPSVIKGLYGEYFASGIRIRGSGGNSNTTLLVMNCILLAIVVLFRCRYMQIKGLHTWLVLVVPILTNFFISSRGEFVHTILLELVYIFYLMKNEKNSAKTLGRIVIIVLLLIATYLFVFKYLYNTNANVKYGIDRLTKLTEVTETDDQKTTDTLMRPLFKLETFWNRFKHSPLWGAGCSRGDAEDFIKSYTGYHNDWFKVLASTGVFGFILWVLNERKFFKIGGLCVLLPLFIAGLSNTFIFSVHAFNTYFFAMGVLLHCYEDEKV